MRSSILVAVVASLSVACSGGGDFDLVVVGNIKGGVYAGSTSAIQSEHQRSQDAAVKGSEGALPILETALKPVQGLDLSNGLVSSDGHVAAVAVQSSGKTRIVSLPDNKEQTTIDTPDVSAVLAVKDDGKLVVFVNNTQPQKVWRAKAGAAPEAIEDYRPGATASIAGEHIFTLYDGQLTSYAPDNSATKVTAPKPYVANLVPEPHGDRMWGIAKSSSGGNEVALFKLKAGSATADAVTGEGFPLFPSRLSVSPGGRLAFISGNALYVTGTDASSPQVANEGTNFGECTATCLAPSGGLVALLCGQSLLVTSTDKTTSKTYYVQTDQTTPVDIRARQ